MVKIRLARAGAKKRPFFHIVAADSRKSRDGRFLERLGYYNPKAKGADKKLVVDSSRVEHWAKTGAQISERVAYLMKYGSPEAPVVKGKAKKAAAAKAA